MEIINIPTEPDDFLGLPMHSHVSLFHERTNYPFNVFESKKWNNVIFRIANIQLTYTNDFLEHIMIYFGFKDKFIFKFNSIEIDGNTSYEDIEQIIIEGKMEYVENWFSEDQLNVCINNWAIFIFDIGEAGILLQNIIFSLNPDVHRSLLSKEPSGKRKMG